MDRRYTPIVVTLASVASVAAHGHVTNIVVNGVSWQTYDPTSFPYMSSPPTVIGWSYEGQDNGFVSPDAYGSPDIICHKGAKPAGGHAAVKAGDKISIQWTVPWPDSHHGPVIDYLADCKGPCESVDKTSLEFFKIDGAGSVSGANPGVWADDVLNENNSTWLVQIPEDLAPGNYVLRHELIALHSANQQNGAQNYPQCFNLEVSGSGSAQPKGTPGTELYKADEPGILFNLYTSPIAYAVPGPTLIPGAASSIDQSSSQATATSTAISGSDSGGNPGNPGSVSTSTIDSPSITSSNPTTPTTTSVATQAPQTTSSPPSQGGVQTKWGQCGGQGWAGATACAPGSSCAEQNPYYSQCL